MTQAYLTENEVAAYLRVSQPTVRRWRVIGFGPRFVKLKRAVRYPAEEVERFAAAALCGNTAEAAERQGGVVATATA